MNRGRLGHLLRGDSSSAGGGAVAAVPAPAVTHAERRSTLDKTTSETTEGGVIPGLLYPVFRLRMLFTQAQEMREVKWTYSLELPTITANSTVRPCLIHQSSLPDTPIDGPGCRPSLHIRPSFCHSRSAKPMQNGPALQGPSTC